MEYRIRFVRPEYGVQQITNQEGIYKEITINEDIYEEITGDRKLVFDILLVKEFFSYVIRNFSILEEEVSRIESKINDNPQISLDRDFLIDDIHLINLNVMNLLTTCRSYLELFDYETKLGKQRKLFLSSSKHDKDNNIRRDLKSIIDKYNDKKDDKKSNKRIIKHDKKIIYDFFWALRNFAQHNGRPIIARPYDSTQAKIDLIVDVNLIFNKDEQISKLKTYLEKKLECYSQKKLQDYPKKLGIRYLIKEYIIILEEVNQEFNRLLSPKLEEKKTKLREKIKYYCNSNSPDSYFEIFRKNREDRNFKEHFDISLEIINSLQKGIEKYSNYTVSRSY